MSQIQPPADPASNPEQPKQKTLDQYIPIWGKLGIMLAVVLLASSGYWRGQFTSELSEPPELPADSANVERRIQAPDTQFLAKTGAPVNLSS